MSSYNSVTDMLNTLVSYIPCDDAVRRETAVIGKPVDLQTIAKIRKSYNRQTPAPVQDNTVTKADQRYDNTMAAASQKLALAIDHARAA